ncbi:MAG: hypothetical protein AVDCRST_MAG45-1998, partial [uncultured Solirubrobacterales bacterium]
ELRPARGDRTRARARPAPGTALRRSSPRAAGLPTRPAGTRPGARLAGPGDRARRARPALRRRQADARGSPRVALGGPARRRSRGVSGVCRGAGGGARARRLPRLRLDALV